MRSLRPYVVGVALGIAVLTFSLRLWEWDPNVPFDYGRFDCDVHFHLPLVKVVTETGWFTTDPYLGAPGTFDLRDFPYAETGLFGLIRLMAFLDHDPTHLFNGFYLLTYLLTIVTAIFSLRRLGVSEGLAISGALLYAFLPYHFFRGVMHPHYSAYHAIPLAVLVAAWLADGDRVFFARDGQGRLRWTWKNGKAVPALVACALLACSGPYYAYFGAVLLAIAGLIGLVRGGERRAGLTEAGVLLGVMAALLAIQVAPFLVHRMREGPNPAVGTRRVEHYYQYGLGLNALLMPSAGHRSALVRGFATGAGVGAAATEGARPLFLRQAESAGATPLGTATGVGLLILLATAVAQPAWLVRGSPRLGTLARLTAAFLLFALLGGFGEIVALHITLMIRCYNRASVVIAFLSVAALVLVGERLRLLWGGRGPWFALGLVGLMTLALVDQIPAGAAPEHARDARVFRSDREFVRKVEALLPQGAMVFQLPALRYPEHFLTRAGGPNVAGYEHLRAYYHSRNLRWSYGAMKGRAVARWQEQVTEQPLPVMLARLREKGFAGLYVDRGMYLKGSDELTSQLNELLGPPAVVDGSGALLLYRLGGRKGSASGGVRESKAG